MARPYSQLLRGPTLKWWRGPLSLLVVAGVMLLAFVVVGVMAVLAPGGSIDLTGAEALDPGLAPADQPHPRGTPAGRHDRGLGRVRLATSLGRLGGLGSALVVARAVRRGLGPRGGDGAAGLDRPERGLPITPEKSWPWYVLVVLATTPLQAAGEEYLFRGWLNQAVGSYLAKPVLGAVVAGGLSSVLFALAHGQQDPWLFVDRLAFGVVASWLVWRTGGLEASIALHVMNNLGAFLTSILTGSMNDALTVTAAGSGDVLVDVVMIVAGRPSSTGGSTLGGPADVAPPVR